MYWSYDQRRQRPAQQEFEPRRRTQHANGGAMRRFRNYVFVAVLLGVSLGSNATTQSGSALQAAAVLADVKAQGARTVVSSLWSDTARWNEVMARIGRGSQEWLKVAAALRPATDAGASEALDEAVFLALKSAPTAVLRLLQDGMFATQTVCSSNIGIDYGPEESKRFIKARIS